MVRVINMKTIDCLCFGACVLDTNAVTQTKNIGGDAANQAILLKRLGFNSILCAVTGKDEAASCLIEELNHHHLSKKWIRSKDHLETTHSLIHLDESGDRSFTVTGGAHREMVKEDFPYELLKDTRALSLGSMFTLHHFEEDGLLDLFKIAKNENCLTFSDTSTDRHHKGLNKASEFFPYLDYFMPSYNEAKELTHLSDPDDIADCLIHRGAKCVIIKLSDKGAALYRKNQKIYVEAYNAKVINTTGAGDHFCAGFIASILSGLSEVQALHNACWLGARAVEHHDCTRTQITPLPYPLNSQNTLDSQENS